MAGHSGNRQPVSISTFLSGEPRDFDFCFGMFSKKINLLKHKVFVHTWYNNTDVSDLPMHAARGGLQYQRLLRVSPTSHFMDSLQFNAFLTEKFPPKAIKNSVMNNDVDPHIPRMLSMFYSIQKSFSLEDVGCSDLYIRSRPDLFFEREINFEEIYEKCFNISRYVIIPDLYINVGNYKGSWTPEGDYCPDFFWIMDNDSRVEMRTIYDDIFKYCDFHRDVSCVDEGNWPMHPEHYLMRWFKKKQIKVLKLNIKMLLGRHYKQLHETGKIYL